MESDEIIEIVKDLIETIKTNYPSDYQKAFNILKKLFENIVLNPNENKYKNFKKTNELIKKQVLNIPECLTLLEVIGYVQSEDPDILTYENESLINISSTLQIISESLKSNTNISQNEVKEYTELPQGNNTYPEDSVIVYQYDLTMGMAKGLAKSIIGIDVEGIWHTAVVYKGQEYFYGGGINVAKPKTTPYGIPIKELNFGKSNISVEAFKNYIKSIDSNYQIQTYDVLYHNCNHFTDDALFFLTGKHLPDSILKQHERLLNTPLGSYIRPMIEQMSRNGNNAMLPNMFENQGNQNFGGFGGY